MTPVNRRTFIGTVAVATASLGSATRGDTQDEAFRFEVERSDKDWRATLTQEEYRVLRQGGTEDRHSSPLVAETGDGTYHCKGCDLTLYDSLWKVQLDIGWVFFRHARPQSVLTGIDGEPFLDGQDLRNIVQMEVHCRRCGSHQGHIVHAQGNLVHCINGASLTFRPAAA